MSKTERRKLFQPIPLSSILDPSHQTPFSKLEQFQFDLDLSKVHTQHPEFEQTSLWRKLQTTLINAMSNLVVISQPVFSTSMGKSAANCATTMSLVPWKSNKSCELSDVINLTDCSGFSSSTLSPSKRDNNYHTQSLYHSVRSGLECLRYFATHPLQEEKVKEAHTCKPNISSFNYTNYEDYSSQVSLTPNIGVTGSSAVIFPTPFPFFIATEQFYHQYSWVSASSQVPAPNLFSLAMSGFLLASPPYLNAFFENPCLVSPDHKFKGSRSSHELPRILDGVNSDIEIIIHATSHQTTQESEKGLGLPVKSDTPSNMSSSLASRKDTLVMGEGGGCIRLENCRGRNNNDDDRPFHSVSVCSSSTLKGGTVTFCSSATVTSSSPRAMAIGCPRSVPRRIRTESESSVDSFVEFSASVESTDSFCIVFESGGPCIDEEYLLEFDRDNDEWEDEDDDDDSEDEEDQVFDYAGEADGEIFQTEIDDGNESQVLPACEHGQTDGASFSTKKQKAKRVSFDEENLVSVIEFEDDVESRRARETYWEVFARDRARFQDRIIRTGDILEPILSVPHRAKVYSSRLLEAPSLSPQSTEHVEHIDQQYSNESAKLSHF